MANLTDLNNQSWLRRGAFAPAPWAATLTPHLLDIEVLFYRETQVEDEFYEFQSETSAITYYQAYAAVEKLERPALDEVLAQGRQTKRTWYVYVPAPPTLDQYPQTGDSVYFVDSEGISRVLRIDSVIAPSEFQAGEHIEVTSSELF